MLERYLAYINVFTKTLLGYSLEINLVIGEVARLDSPGSAELLIVIAYVFENIYPYNLH